nr:uncharacterized protein LOC104894456 [Ipomoea batatas]
MFARANVKFPNEIKSSRSILASLSDLRHTCITPRNPEEAPPPSRSASTTSVHVTVSDGLVNVNSLFTVAVFVGLSLATPGQKIQEVSSNCDVGIDYLALLVLASGFPVLEPVKTLASPTSSYSSSLILIRLISSREGFITPKLKRDSKIRIYSDFIFHIGIGFGSGISLISLSQYLISLSLISRSSISSLTDRSKPQTPPLTFRNIDLGDGRLSPFTT